MLPFRYTPISTMCTYLASVKFIDSECFILTGTFGSKLLKETLLILVNRHFNQTRADLLVDH